MSGCVQRVQLDVELEFATTISEGKLPPRKEQKAKDTRGDYEDLLLALIGHRDS